MAATVVKSPTYHVCLSNFKLAVKVKSEIKELCSHKHNSILRDTIEAVKHFHWETVFLELVQKVPTLMHLMRQFIAKSNEKKPLLCFLASQILNSRNMHIGLVQRAVSISLYGKGTEQRGKYGIYFNVFKKYHSKCTRIAATNNVCLSYR